jgi:signal transduction histidine kinase
MTRDNDLESPEKGLRELQEENEMLRSGYMSLTQQLMGLRMIQHVVRDLVSELDLDRLLKRILRSAIHAADGTAGALLLLDPSGQELVFSVVEGGGGTVLRGQRMGSDMGVAGWVLAQNEPILIADVREDERFLESISSQVDYEVRSLICIPLVAKGEVIGVIQVLNKATGDSFNDDDLTLLNSFAAQSATAIENARLYQDLKRERDRIIAIEEDVRKQLARNLHDGPAQLLASIIANIEFIRKLLVYEPDKAPGELDNLVPLAQKALDQVRTLLFDLRPVILETQGLGPALESYVRRQQEMDSPVRLGPEGEGRSLAYHLEIRDFSGRLVPAAERAVFTIVQEAVGNVRKHARAQNAWITLAHDDGELLVEVRDDGQGFDVEKMRRDYDERGSLGMLNIDERSQALGGKLSIRSQLGQGTTISLTVPLQPLRRPEG